jgi:hypothetical protein
LTVQARACGQCGRTVLEHGHVRIVEAARTLDGREPAEEFIQQLLQSNKERDRQRLNDTVMIFEEYGRNGTLRIPRELNQLRGELWETKAGDLRFPFYLVQDDKHPAPVARLTGAFRKQTQRTPRKQIDNAQWVMGEDRQS